MGFFKKLKARLFTLNYEVVDETPQEKITALAQNPVEDAVIRKAEKKVLKQQVKEAKAFEKLRQKEQKVSKYVVGLKKSRGSFFNLFRKLQLKHHELDEAYFEQLEEILIMSDVGVHLTNDIIEEIKDQVRRKKVTNSDQISEIVFDKMFKIYTKKDGVNTKLQVTKGRLNVVLLTGVNGVGKTTTIAKLVNIFKEDDYKVLIVAADTFRAGAVEQLEVWANRLETDIVVPDRQKQDPASVIYKAIQKAKAEKYDLVIIDTAGRLQNKVNLMKELEKMNRIIEREVPGAPHESLLVIDATTGQNGIRQAVEFQEITNLSGIVLTKMDGTSKGGIVLAIKEKLNLPVKYIGLGETINDLQEFDLDSFIYGLTKDFVDDRAA